MRKLLMAVGIAMIASAAIADPASAPVPSSDAATTPSSAQAPAAKDEPKAAPAKKICKNVDAGFSHRTERVCMTAEQWEEYNRGE